MSSPIGAHPPRPQFALNVGITGHRAHALDDVVVVALQERFDEIFSSITKAALAVYEQADGRFSTANPKLRLHTALATGADQLAATSARKCGYIVRALLPFPAEEYKRDFTDRIEHQRFCQQLDAVDGHFALPGTREAEEDAYVLVGKAVIAAADIIVAVWDGKAANGPGGTAHVVDLALRAGVPVLHIPVNRDHQVLEDTRLLVGGDTVEPRVAPLTGQDGLENLIRDELVPTEAMGLADLDAYLAEEESDANWRIEYQLLLAALGIRKLPKRPWRQVSVAGSIAAHGGGGYEPPPAQAIAYEWANFLAIRYAQLFRSGHVTNYLLAALAVLTALAGLILPHIKPALVFGELCILGLLLLNTRVGSANAWHRKWLQYRHLAESLRSLSYLKRTSLIGPPSRDQSFYGERGRGAVGDWTRWYAAAVWREMPSAEGLMDETAVRELADEVREQHIEGQIGYHRVNATRMHHLDHRLHLVGEAAMSIVIIACGAFLVLSATAYDLLKTLTPIFVFITAGFPALGAAVFGLRGHGEHLLAASRSASTANALADNSETLAKVTRIEELTRELERTAEIMLSDLNEWTVAYSERSLQVPG